MFDLTGIMGLARYEGKLLRRTWKFWILVVLASLALSLIKIYQGVVSDAISSFSGSMGGFYSPGNIFQSTFLFYNMLFAILLIWFCYDFLSRDRQVRVEGVLHSRPPSTFSLVWGKFLGAFITVALIAIALIPLATLVFALVAAVIKSFAPWIVFRTYFPVVPYLVQVFAITLPSMAFVIALVFFLATVTRSRVAAILIAHAYVLVDFIAFLFFGYWLRIEYVPIVDFTGYGLLSFYSDLSGFSDLHLVLLHRGYVIALTLLLLALTAWLHPRLHQAGRVSGPVRLTALACALLCLGYAGFTVARGHGSIAAREEAKAEQQGLVERPLTTVTHYAMEVDLTRDHRLDAAATLTVRNDNDEPQEQLTFVLNSGLDVDEVAAPGGEPLDYERGLTVLTVNIPPLAPGAETDLRLAWHGGIDTPTLFLNSALEINELKGNQRNNTAILGDRPAQIKRRCTYLVPQVRWYPSPNVDYGYAYPERNRANFATTELTVTVPEGCFAVSQGELADRQQSAGSGTVHRFVSRVPVPGISINAGAYAVARGEVGGFEASIYYLPDHGGTIEFFRPLAEEIRAEAEETLAGIKDATGLEYPYPALSLVEVPDSIRAYTEGWDSPNPLIQPGVVMLKESGFFKSNFEFGYNIRSRNAREESGDEELPTAEANEIKMRMLKTFFDLDVLSGSMVQNAMQSFWGFRLQAMGPLYPLAGMAFDNYVKEIATESRPMSSVYSLISVNQNQQNMAAAMSRGKSITEAVYDTIFDKATIYDAMLETPLAEMKPGDDPELFFKVMSFKGRGFVVCLREAMGHENFRALIGELLARYRHGHYTFDDLRRTAEEVSGRDLGDFFAQWTHTTDLPGYKVVESKAWRIAGEGEIPRYQLLLQLANEEETGGFAVATFHTREDEIERRLTINGGETVEVALVVSDEPERVVVDPILARNRERIEKDYDLPEEPVDAEPLERVAVVAAAEVSPAAEVIVDDLDQGFSLAGEDGGGLLRWRSGGGDEGEAPEIPEYIRGVPDEWTNWTSDEAYGLYNQTMKVKAGGEGGFSARWAAELSRRGRYEVFVYIGVEGEDLRAREEDEKLGSDYRYTVESDDGDETVSFDAAAAEEGWNSLGTFYFSPDREAVVVLSDEADGAVIADAVKFVYEEEKEEASE